MVSACAVRRWLAAEVLDPGNIDAGFIRGIPPSSLRPSERWISTLSPVSSDTSPLLRLGLATRSIAARAGGDDA